jgi:hypothetical protein
VLCRPVEIPALSEISNNVGSIKPFMSALLHSVLWAPSYVIFIGPMSTIAARTSSCGRFQSDLHVTSIQFQTMITGSNSLWGGIATPLRSAGGPGHFGRFADV